MKKVSLALTLAVLVCVSKSPAITLDDIQFWAGSGTNRAALVIEWSTPESLGSSTVPAPIANKSLVWGYRFNGTASGAEMFNAIVTADSRLFVVETVFSFGFAVNAIGYHLGGGGDLGISDEVATNFFAGGLLTNSTVNIDAAAALNSGDLYWGGWEGPNWETWNEAGNAGGFFGCPDRGANAYWTSDDPNNGDSLGNHGQWRLNWGLGSITLTNGSWFGFSVAAGELEWGVTPLSAPYYAHKHAPAEPDPSITALVKHLTGGWQAGQWHVQFVSCTNWNYALERSSNLQTWITVASNVPGNSVELDIPDPATPADNAFYRVRAEHP